MNVDDIMTTDPACCTPDTPLREVARMMVLHDCGEIPLVQNPDEAVVLGVVTDRDIVCRLIAEGENPLDLTAASCMSHPAITVSAGSSLEDCCHVMEAHQIRRVPIIDASGTIRGIVSQADIATRAPKTRAANLVREVSEPPSHYVATGP
jgi:CBS domain-containing protein